jgi:transcriptional regulator with XRE-family HTH domain
MKAQIKAARDLLGITEAELCEAAGIPVSALRRIEGSQHHTGLVPEGTVVKVRAALEAQGIQFPEQDDASNREGVTLQWSD